MSKKATKGEKGGKGEKTKKRSWIKDPNEETQTSEETEEVEPFEVVVTRLLDRIANALEEGNKLYKEAMGKAVAQQPTPKPVETAKSTESGGSTKGVEDVKNMFNPELQGQLIFTDAGDHVVVKPARYLGSENFAKIASIVRDNGGEYVSAGKESHFKVPKK